MQLYIKRMSSKDSLNTEATGGFRRLNNSSNAKDKNPNSQSQLNFDFPINSARNFFKDKLKDTIIGSSKKNSPTQEIIEGDIYVKNERRLSKDPEISDYDPAIFHVGFKAENHTKNSGVRTITKKQLNKREIHIEKGPGNTSFGVALDVIEERYTVIHLEQDTPAYRVGINWGDQVISVNGNSVDNFYADDIQNLLDRETMIEMEIIEQPLIYRTKINLDPNRNKTLTAGQILRALGLTMESNHILNVNAMNTAHLAGLQEGQSIVSIEGTCVVNKNLQQVGMELMCAWKSPNNKIRLILIEHKILGELQQVHYQYLVTNNLDTEANAFVNCVESSL